MALSWEKYVRIDNLLKKKTTAMFLCWFVEYNYIVSEKIMHYKMYRRGFDLILCKNVIVCSIFWMQTPNLSS